MYFLFIGREKQMFAFIHIASRHRQTDYDRHCQVARAIGPVWPERLLPARPADATNSSIMR